jgi:hypothetical protein
MGGIEAYDFNQFLELIQTLKAPSGEVCLFTQQHAAH